MNLKAAVDRSPRALRGHASPCYPFGHYGFTFEQGNLCPALLRGDEDPLQGLVQDLLDSGRVDHRGGRRPSLEGGLGELRHGLSDLEAQVQGIRDTIDTRSEAADGELVRREIGNGRRVLELVAILV